MTKNLDLNIVDTHQEIFHGKVTQVTVSATMGGLTIFAGHSQLITSLKPGEINFAMADGKVESLFVSGGIIEVQPTIVTILADTIIRSSELDEKVAKEPIKRASEKVKTIEVDSESYQELMQEMQVMRALLELSKKNKPTTH